ncbi:AcrR family transcriptional regulator [Kribbella aluminosa]|uniref:AcrR family transcriptional regulator n=1 Tax=Kribbella aluminosa TaxID=416017 RepID=A0ABS4UCP7_9ACTN|nr:TetR/AcrR family transcriptional regulator [Kribbella aluminosa]MBP2349388.1 AcrR family transcriptional regulator [Kribbella aluminosa]
MTTRAEQRRRTETRILAAARELFGELGFDRTTVRMVASRAGSDPGLVMRYFGSKEQLFAQAAAIPADGAIEGTPDEIAAQLTAALTGKLAEEPTTALAALRAMFSHPEAADEVRKAMTEQQRQIAGQLRGDDALVRSGVIGALTLGLVVSRHLVRLDGLDVPPDELMAIAGPLIEELVIGSRPIE